MTGRTFTGLLLILGPLVALGGFMTLIATVEGPTRSETIANFGDNSGLVKTLYPIATLGLIMVLGGLAGLTKSMGEGKGKHYASVGVIVLIVGIAAIVVEHALLIGVAEAALNGQQAITDALDAASNSVGSAGTSLRFLGFAVIGLGFLLQNTINKILATFMIIVGIIGTVIPLVDYSSSLMAIGYLGYVVVNIATGVFTLRSKE